MHFINNTVISNLQHIQKPLTIKIMQEQQKQIKNINKLLVKHFGIPPKNEKLPNPLEMIIATILSQNTNDKNSYQAYRNLKDRFRTFEELANARRSSIEKEIRIAGLGKQKSEAIKNLLTDLKEKRNSLSLDFVTGMKNEDAVKELSSYKGVGVKTASCVLLFSLERDVCPVDTHVHRTLNRIGLVKTSAPEKTFFEINNTFPKGIAHSFHTNLIRLGREICKPKNPSCCECPLLKICKYEEKNLVKPKLSKSNSFMLLDNIG